MSRLATALRDARASGRGAFIPYVVAGDPTPGASLEILRRLEESGAAAIEVGIPWSDPVADGEANQAAMMRALDEGMSCARTLELIGELRTRSRIPVVVMTYANPVSRMGWGRFVDEAVAAGVDGLLVTDLPPEEGTELALSAGDAGIDVVQLHAPTTPPSRDATLLRACSGFLYVVARMGVTGEGMGSVAAELEARVARLRRPEVNPDALPLAIGFGISTPADLALAWSFAEGAVVGSSFSRAIQEALELGRDPADLVGERARWLLHG